MRHLRNGFLSLMAPELVQLSPHAGRRARRAGPAARSGGAGAGDRAARRDPRRAAPRPRSPRAGRGRPGPADHRRRRRRPTTSARWRHASPKLEQAAAEALRRRPAGTGRSGHRSHGARRAGPPRRPTPRRRAGRRPPDRGARDLPPPAPRHRRPAPRPCPTTSREWEQRQARRCEGIVRALFTPARGRRRGAGGTVTLAAPNATHRDKCEQHRAAVEQAWQAATGRAVTVDVVARRSGQRRPTPATRAGRPPRAADRRRRRRHRPRRPRRRPARHRPDDRSTASPRRSRAPS